MGYCSHVPGSGGVEPNPSVGSPYSARPETKEGGKAGGLQPCSWIWAPGVKPSPSHLPTSSPGCIQLGVQCWARGVSFSPHPLLSQARNVRVLARKKGKADPDVLKQAT